jgi:kinetochore protein Spc25
MESMRLICDRDAKIQLHKVDSFMASFCNSLDSIKAIVEETMQNQGQRKSGIAEFFTLLYLAFVAV